MTNRVRFAPSPTGYLHVGSARTALFNWLYARGHDATFVLRIEDTDEQRSQPELVDQILRTMEWLGLDWDEGPFYQSDRRERHGEVVEQLLGSEHAYIDEGAVRFRMPKGETITTDDAVRGRVEWNTDDLPDFVIRRSDGSAMFALANAIDDLDMGITHAIRGTDLLNVVPQVKLITAALGGGDGPTYAHLPLLVNEQRKKLSKRRDDVAIEDYRERGYLPEAMTNFLALLGWGPRDEVEIRPIAEIAKLFRLEDINDADAFFDLKKLEHFNATYIREMTVPDFVAATSWPPSDAASNPTVAELAPLVQLRARTLNDVEGLVDWVFAAEVEIEDAAWEKAVINGKAATEILDETITAFETVPWEVDDLHATLAGIGEGHDLKLGKTQAPVRVAVSGRLVGLPLFESLHVIGRDETLRRLRAARARL